MFQQRIGQTFSLSKFPDIRYSALPNHKTVKFNCIHNFCAIRYATFTSSPEYIHIHASVEVGRGLRVLYIILNKAEKNTEDYLTEFNS